MGGALLVAPYFATVALAGQVLAASGDEDAMARWLPGIADGSLTATLAVAEDSGSWDLADVAATAEPAGHGWAVTGSKRDLRDRSAAAEVSTRPAKFVSGRYLDRLERRDGQWRILVRRATIEVEAEGDAKWPENEISQTFPKGAWDVGDLSYARPLQLDSRSPHWDGQTR